MTNLIYTLHSMLVGINNAIFLLIEIRRRFFCQTGSICQLFSTFCSNFSKLKLIASLKTAPIYIRIFKVPVLRIHTLDKQSTVLVFLVFPSTIQVQISFHVIVFDKNWVSCRISEWLLQLFLLLVCSLKKGTFYHFIDDFYKLQYKRRKTLFFQMARINRDPPN